MDTLYAIFIAIFGLVFGSFFCCMGYRIPNKISVSKPSSFCPKCKKSLKWYMNIPLFSYIFLGGKCAYCKTKIDIIYPMTELITSVLFLGAYLIYGFSYEFGIVIILSSMFVVTAVSDFIYYYVSDRVVVISLIGIVILNFIFKGFNFAFTNILIGLLMFALMYGIKLFGDYVFKKESLGGGDIKLMGVVSIALGLLPSVVALFLASIMGLLFSLFTIKKNKNGIIPFGPFIILGAMIVFYFIVPITNFFDIIIS